MYFFTNELAKIQDEFDRVFSSMLSNDTKHYISYVDGNYPKLNIIEKKDSFCIIAATPGLEREDIKISVKDNILYIKGDSKQDASVDDRFLMREIKKSSFMRSVGLNDAMIDLNKISSKYKNGELTIILPKKEEKVQKIDINID